MFHAWGVWDMFRYGASGCRRARLWVRGNLHSSLRMMLNQARPGQMLQHPVSWSTGMCGTPLKLILFDDPVQGPIPTSVHITSSPILSSQCLQYVHTDMLQRSYQGTRDACCIRMCSISSKKHLYNFTRILFLSTESSLKGLCKILL